MNWYAHVTVASVVTRNKKFLLVREHADGADVLNQPAGHLEEGESLVDAAVREALEETGWQIKPTAFLGLSQYTSPVNNVTYIRASFAADPINEIENAKLDTDIIEAVWMDYEEIRKNKTKLRSPLVLADVERYLSGKLLPLNTVLTV